MGQVSGVGQLGDWVQVNAAETAGLVAVYLDPGPLEVNIRLYPDEARAFAARLIEAAEQVEGATNG